MNRLRDRNILILLAALFTFVLAISTSKIGEYPYYDEKLRASERTLSIFMNIAGKEREYLHTHDLIGKDYSGITTTLGSIKSKKTSINPNFSAVIMDMLLACGLKRGDEVAINLSGSFPALNFAAIVAVEELGCIPVIISSIGSSTYGANDPKQTYQDMEHQVYEAGLISVRSILVSPGGDGDIGLNMDPEILLNIEERLARYGYTIYNEPNINTNLDKRMNLMKDAKVLINVGGNLVSQFHSDIGYTWDYGLILPTQKLNYREDGLIGRFLGLDKPVIQMLNVVDIAVKYQLPIEPDIIAKPGEGDVFVGRIYYGVSVCAGILLFLMVVIRDGYLQRKEKSKKIRDCILSKNGMGYDLDSSVIGAATSNQCKQS
ncbi:MULTISPECIES: poly-gamma-glutamate system protein [unclassified Fusibacter]|uniref:poly-gamma-glutamate system protein n=1 Tax=unclassified Fusibacter TaxID=2624464 RepID=UPI0013E92474|nr:MULTISPECIES: poly-gamma-glutamate system protein [unclassified Fusibacter]MCK8061074.1 poly-gamma-glutamate system protein [Fusibacter sp. A2]NPE20472.1 poly-gamma-glutamate system protein [Fusibacter sp. A1]